MKQLTYTCDLCGKQDTYIPDGWYVLKAKKRWISWYESDWQKKDVYICNDCIDGIKTIMQSIRTYKSEEEVE